MIAVFDIAGPLVVYSRLRAAGLSAVSALIISGVLPAIGVVIGIIQHRRLDVIGAMVLLGIFVGTVLGLVSHNARLVLIEGSVPTALFGLVCLGSLRARRPLMFSFALEFLGPDTAKGREMTSLWQYWTARHAFRVITAAWGFGYLAEAAVRVVIIQHTSTSAALAFSKVMPFIFAATLGIWTGLYGAQQRRKGERQAAADADADADATAALEAGTCAAGSVTPSQGQPASPEQPTFPGPAF
jgi:intracellular septation protein A